MLANLFPQRCFCLLDSVDGANERIDGVHRSLDPDVSEDDEDEFLRALSSNKRKREATTDDVLYDLLGPFAAQANAKQEHRRPQKKLKVKQPRKQSSLLRDLRHYALGAALGATGTFTLLASPLGGMLADWASSV